MEGGAERLGGAFRCSDESSSSSEGTQSGAEEEDAIHGDDVEQLGLWERLKRSSRCAQLGGTTLEQGPAPPIDTEAMPCGAAVAGHGGDAALQAAAVASISAECLELDEGRAYPPSYPPAAAARLEEGGAEEDEDEDEWF